MQRKQQRRQPAKFIAEPFGFHQLVEVHITDLTNLGVGVGRVDSWVVMVQFALPGERVRARIFRNHKNYSEGDLVEVIEPSPDRVTPECELFGVCGGCQYQNLAYPAQLQWKQKQLVDLLERMAGLSYEVDPVVGSPRQYGYRTKLTPHYNKPRGGPVTAIGFLEVGRRYDLVDVKQCPLATPEINLELPAFRDKVRQEGHGRSKGATLLLRHSKEGVTSDHHEIVTEEINGLTLKFAAGTFFQNNPYLLPELVNHVAAEASAGNLDFLIDAYCGCGLFALSCAARFTQVSGVELSKKSIAWARQNLAANGIDNCEFLAADAAQVFAGIEFDPLQTCIVIDPPRRGCDMAFLTQLFEYRPARVVYVSCNPATQLRDLKEFLEHGYCLKRIRPFDMFPQTKHLECVMTLELE